MLLHNMWNRRNTKRWYLYNSLTVYTFCAELDKTLEMNELIVIYKSEWIQSTFFAGVSKVNLFNFLSRFNDGRNVFERHFSLGNLVKGVTWYHEIAADSTIYKALWAYWYGILNFFEMFIECILLVSSEILFSFQ